MIASKKRKSKNTDLLVLHQNASIQDYASPTFYIKYEYACWAILILFPSCNDKTFILQFALN